MNHEELMAEAHTLGRWERHRFMLLVAITIVISLVLVGIALALYKSSGAAQLDLSRPGYVTVRDQVSGSEKFKSFSSTGRIDEAAIEEFRALYQQQASQATEVDSFGGSVLSDEALLIAPPEPTP